MDRGLNTVTAAGIRKCNCRYCRAGCFHGNRGLASAQQRQPIPYIQTKKTDPVNKKRNGALLPLPGTEPVWAQRQKGRIRAWRQAEKIRAQAEKIRAQAEKIRAWRQALNKEAGQAVSGDQTEGMPVEPSPMQEESTANQDTGLAPITEQPDQVLNGDSRDTELSAPECQAPDSAGDAHLISSSEPGESESRNAAGQLSEPSTCTEQQRLEPAPPIEKTTAKIKRKVSAPTDKTWALEQAARIKAWREAKNREVIQEPESQSVDVPTEDVEDLPLIQTP